VTVAPAARPLEPRLCAETNVVRQNIDSRRYVIEALLFACVTLSAWIIVLALTLPRRYDASHWNLAWIGFDVALLAGLSATAWAAWRRRVVIILFATATATLLCADAWFDMTTARPSDLWASATLAGCAELPGAIFLVYVVVRVVNYTRGSVWTDRYGTRPRSLWSVEFTHPSEADPTDAEALPEPVERPVD
jgi:hypothetical protein